MGDTRDTLCLADDGEVFERPSPELNERRAWDARGSPGLKESDMEDWGDGGGHASTGGDGSWPGQPMGMGWQRGRSAALHGARRVSAVKGESRSLVPDCIRSGLGAVTRANGDGFGARECA